MPQTLEDHYGLDRGQFFAGTSAYQKAWDMAHSGDWTAVENYLSSLGDNWKQLVAANPYKNINYRQSGLQRIADWLGFRTKYDSALEQANLQSQEYLSGLMMKAYNEQYETPLAESQRLKQAGINPDLQGLEGVNGASPMPEDNNVMSPDTFADDSGMVKDIVGTAQTAFSALSGAMQSALSIAGSLQSLNAGRLANTDTSLDVLMKFLNATQNKNIMGDPHQFDTFFNRLPLSRMQKRKLGPLMSQMRDSLSQELSYMDNMEKYGNSREKVVKQSNNELQNPYWMSVKDQLNSPSIQTITEFESYATKKMAEINAKMVDIKYKYVKEISPVQAEADLSRAQNDLREQNALQKMDFDTQVAANNVQQQNVLDEQSALNRNGYFRTKAQNMQYQQDINKVKLEWDEWFTNAKKEMLDKIQAAAKKGSLLDKALLYAITASGFITDSGLGQIASSAASMATGIKLPSFKKEPNFNDNFEIQQYSF